ncbi:SafA/ExsA family spore coat assembly protein [Crassaminicella profunda]|nr:SafA/ExsA family spore coat assembly protein [Crassaminicella profunda]QZY54507.1 SafA/ExsA family spore coat assembly protein [Crassaminicella profunda]
MKKFLTICVMLLFIITIVPASAQAASNTYTVQSGDSMWKIAVKYEVGLSEIIASNPQIKNPALIYPGQKLNIPNIQDIKTLENQVIKLVNIERSKKGLPALKSNWQLSRCARYKSQDMINKNYFSHQSPTYGSPFKMMESFGLKFSSAGENIAKGQRTPKEVMNSWMNSPGHRSNILSSSFSEIGVGLAKDKYGRCYWTQMFMRPTR